MNNYDFPRDERLSPTTNSRQIHTVLLRMMKVFKMICATYEIDFWLEYGTLLGAIRNNGFIPWDHEADIGMLRPDFDKFTAHAIKDLPPDIFFQTRVTDPAYETAATYIEAKLRDKYSNYIEFEKANPEILWHNGIQVDIFVYDLIQLNGQPILVNEYERLITQAGSFLHTKEIEELEECDFEDTTFLIPCGYHEYLTRNYGNYLELPPIEEQRAQYADIILPCRHKEILRW